MPEDLIIPVYLNQRIVFDLLAMREGGISHITKVVSSQETSDSEQRRYGSEFGLSKALSSLLSISVSGDRTKSKENEVSTRRDEERVHTPASLFYRLRSQLLQDGVLRQVKENTQVELHQIVEFKAELRRSPLIETIDSMTSLFEMAVLFDDQKQPQKGQPKPHGKGKSESILDQMRSFGEKLRSGDTVDLVAEGIRSDTRALITLETEYLNDPTMADLVDGSFKITGKVIRMVDENSSISLLRKSALSMMPQGILDQMFDAFGTLAKKEGFNIPAAERDLRGPAFQVLPIAIFT